MSISTKVKDSLSRASWIRKMFEEGDRLSQIHGRDKVYDFTIGNPDLEPPAAFKERLLELAEHPIPGMHRYMSNAGYPEARQSIAAYLNRKTGIDLNAGQIVMAVGAGGGLNVVFKTLLDPGDEIIVSSPYFVEYGFYVNNHGGKLVVVKSRPNFQLDLTAIAAAITPQTKAIMINSPNNPTGVIYGEALLKDLAAIIRQKEAQFGKTLYLISDEPYSSLVYDNQTVPSVLNIFDHSLLVTSHSKDLAIPGERIGYIAINPKIPEVELLFDGLVFATRVLGFVNAPALMQRLVASLQGQSVGTAVYQERRDLLYNHLTKSRFQISQAPGRILSLPRKPYSRRHCLCPSSATAQPTARPRQRLRSSRLLPDRLLRPERDHHQLPPRLHRLG